MQAPAFEGGVRTGALPLPWSASHSYNPFQERVRISEYKILLGRLSHLDSAFEVFGSEVVAAWRDRGMWSEMGVAGKQMATWYTRGKKLQLAAAIVGVYWDKRMEPILMRDLENSEGWGVRESEEAAVAEFRKEPS